MFSVLLQLLSDIYSTIVLGVIICYVYLLVLVHVAIMHVILSEMITM